MTSVAGDALLAVALADSVFFSLPVGESRVRAALFLALTICRSRSRAGAGADPRPRGAAPLGHDRRRRRPGPCWSLLLAPNGSTSRRRSSWCWPILVLAKVHAVSKNALTMAYANREDGLLRANAPAGADRRWSARSWRRRSAYLVLTFLGVSSPLYVRGDRLRDSARLAMRLPQPRRRGAAARGDRGGARVDGPRGSLPHLAAPAIGAIGLRAAGGFLIFLLAFALRSAEVPAYWFAVLAAAGVVGGFLVDLAAPTLPRSLREESIVVVCIAAAGRGRAARPRSSSGCPLLAVYAFIAGAATELARLAMQSLVQRDAPADALGRVFVRYEALYQVAWVGAAFIPTVLPISFRPGMLVLVGVLRGARRGVLVAVAARARPRAGP